MLHLGWSADAKLFDLAEVPLFEGCRRHELITLGRMSEDLVVPAGTMLTREGAPGRWWFAVRQGLAGVTRRGRPTGVLGPGDWWGEAAILRCRNERASAVALTDMSLITISHKQFVAMLDNVPRVNGRLLRHLAHWESPYESVADSLDALEPAQ
jgi:CRP/FNR family transcriptional regulator, cyclic AMP receptor protein